MSEPIEVSGNFYQISRMEPLVALHVTRRLAPFMGAIMAGLREGATAVDVVAAALPLTEVMASMSDENVNYVIKACLGVCQRQNDKHGGGWSAVMASNGRPMFSDIGLPEMLQLTWAAIQENLGGFFSGLPSGSEGATPTAA